MNTGAKVALGLLALYVVAKNSGRKNPTACSIASKKPGTHLTPGAVYNPPLSQLVLIQAPGSDYPKKYVAPQVVTPYLSLVSAARRAGFPAPLLDINSGYRSYQEQNVLWVRKVTAIKEQNPTWSEAQVYDLANDWVSPPGSSSHETGLALDFNMGYGYTNANLEKMRNSLIFKWLVKYAQKFGFYNYHKEPWHWVYNPTCTQEEGYAV